MLIKYTCKCLRTLHFIFFLYTWRKTSACSETFTADTGTFTSPNYPNNYPNGAVCQYEIFPATDGTSLRLVFDIFDTEKGRDGVEVYDEDGDLQFSVSGGRYGWVILPTMKAYYLRFVSDNSKTFDGFTATWSVAQSSDILDYRVAMAIGCSIRGEFRPAAPRNGIRKSEIIAIPDSYNCMLLCYNVPGCLYFSYDKDDGECNMFEENAGTNVVYNGIIEKVYAN